MEQETYEDEAETTTCPACGHENDTALGTLGRLRWYRCRACGVDYNVDAGQAEDQQAGKPAGQ